MQIQRTYRVSELLMWTRWHILKFIVWATIAVVLYEVVGLKWLTIPWVPITLIGTAAAFYVGFKNNSSYARLWEARQIWGAIINSSRTWGIMVLDFITNDFADEKISDDELYQIKKRLIYRHIAWVTALRFQLRTPRTWEHDLTKGRDAEYLKLMDVAEHRTELKDEITPFLSKEEKDDVLDRKNTATHIVKLQSKELRELRKKGLIEDFRHMEMEKMLADFYTQQGKSERIKNFPFPRQYATVNLFFIWIFIILLPFGLIREFETTGTAIGTNLGRYFIWLTIPFSAMVAWVFHTMEQIGDYSENPFEGSSNDVPITALSRTIEIDLRDMLDEKDLPKPIEAVNNILM